MDRRDTNEAPPILKVVGLEDADRVTELLNASYPALWRGVYEDDVLNAVLPLFCTAQDDLLQSNTFFLAEDPDTGMLLGVGGWTHWKAGSSGIIPGEGHVRHFAVHANAQRQGVGRMIINATLESARKHGIHTLHCTSSLTADRYYNSFGFEFSKRTTIPVNGVEVPVIAMVWHA